jgi:PAS domain S-box-containing protein
MGTRWLLVAAAGVAALVLAAILAGWPVVLREPGLTLALAAGFAATIIAVAIGVEVLVRAPLARLVQSLDLAKRSDVTRAFDLNAGGEIGAVARGVEELRGRLKSARDEADRLGEICRTAEQALRESEQRYAMAVKGANDGMFEWDIKTGKAFYSPRWKSMLGYRESEIGENIEEWHSRTHPDDVDDVQARMRDHLDGRTERFENEHRLRCRDGSYCWVLARATAIRRASGAPYRVVGLHTDISSRKHTQEMLLELAEGLTSARGEEYFRTLVRNFAGVLRTRDAFLCEALDRPVTRVRTLAYWTRGDFHDNVEFDLAGTTCEEVIATGRILYCPHSLGDRWPMEKREYDRESYLGIPIFDSIGNLVGHIACMDDKPMREELPHQAIVKLFAVCAATEMERRLLAQERSAMIKRQGLRTS